MKYNNSIEKIKRPVVKMVDASGVGGPYIVHIIFTIVCLLNLPISTSAQNSTTTQNASAITNSNPNVETLTLQQCIDYAKKNQPVQNQALIGEHIAKTTNAINISGWLPQAGVSANYQHYFELPTSVIGTTTEKTGVINTFIPEFVATQTIFNPSLLYAATSAHTLLKEAQQITDTNTISIIATVSQSFYNLLLTLEQINVYKEDTALFAKNLRDAYNQYVGGIVDKTDYEEATITLNNAKAQLKQANENITPQYAILKQAMGYPPQNQFNVVFDTAQMMQNIVFDSTEQLQFEKRIEFQQIKTAEYLQHQATNYYKYNFAPTLSAFYDYDYELESNTGSDLFGKAYPYSFIGLSINIPLFTGFSRLESIHRSKLQEQVLNWNENGLKSIIYTQYTSALGNYKSNLYDLTIMRDNEAMAKEVYGIVVEQYKQGIVPYLNVITAESNLVSAEIGYLNALFQVLSSKIDLEKSMGDISSNH